MTAATPDPPKKRQIGERQATKIRQNSKRGLKRVSVHSDELGPKGISRHSYPCKWSNKGGYQKKWGGGEKGGTGGKYPVFEKNFFLVWNI